MKWEQIFISGKKTVDVSQLYSIVDKLNDEVKAVLTKHNELLQSARLEMGIENYEEFELLHDFYLPDKHSDFGDIHVGKRSGGWKPLMQANKHFHSIQTLKQFVDAYNKFGEYKLKYRVPVIHKNPDSSKHFHKYRDFSLSMLDFL
jgi:hypothetical protein